MRKKEITNGYHSFKDVTYTSVYKKGVKKGFFITDRRADGFKKYVWNIDGKGYAYTMIDGKKVHLHKYLTNYTYTDHINRNRLDNRRRNLREVTPQENSFNRSFNKYGVPSGVWPENNRWRVTLTKNGYVHKVGRFDDLLDAVLARQEAEQKYFGDVVNDYSSYIKWLHDTMKSLS